MRTWIKRILLALVGLAVVAAAVLAFLPEPLPVETTDVAHAPLTVTVDGPGQARLLHKYVVSAPVAGRLERITLRPGDDVRQGQQLAWLDPPPSPLLDPRTRAALAAQVAAAEAAAAEAHAAIDLARTARQHALRERDRARTLAASGTLPTQTLETAEFELRARSRAVESAELAAATAQAQVEAARANLAGAEDPAEPQRTPVLAPVAGRVLRLLQESETMVAPGMPLLELGDPSAVEVVVDLRTADAVRVQPGMPVRLEQWGGPNPLAGVVRLVEPSAFTKLSALGIEEQRVFVRIDPAPDADWSPLGDGYRVEARIVVWDRPDALVVPTGALFRHADGWAAFVVDQGHALLRPVQTGQRGVTDVEIVAGLQPGEHVVLHPSDKLASGAEVAAE
jgi:HlyD family secretion protein